MLESLLKHKETPKIIKTVKTEKGTNKIRIPKEIVDCYGRNFNFIWTDDVITITPQELKNKLEREEN